MFKKPSLILAATLIATLSAQSSAFADNNRSQVIDHRTPANETVRDHRTPPKAAQRTAGRKTVIDHRVPATKAKRGQKTRRNEVVIIKRIPCSVGYNKLRSNGYDHIVMFDCTGAKYKYLAQKSSAIFNANMHAYSGTLVVNYMGPLRR